MAPCRENKNVYRHQSPPFFSKKAMPWGKKWPVQMNLPFFAVKAYVPGGVQNQAEKNSKTAFRPVPVQKFTFPALRLRVQSRSRTRLIRKLEKAVAVRNSLLEKFSGKFRRCWKFFADFPAARNAIPAKVWAVSGKENGCWKIGPAFGNAPGFSPLRPPHPSRVFLS